MRLVATLLLLLSFPVKADYISTNQAVVEVSALYPGAVLSANYLVDEEEVFVRILSPAGMVQKLVVCKLGSDIKIKEIKGEDTSSGRSSCNSLTAEN